jgi:isopenicillin N synthase-like dioxygenase
MASNQLNSLPVIKIAPLLNANDERGRLATSAALHAACIQYGFFYLDLIGFSDPEEPEELSELARQFFSLPQEEKDKLALRNQDGARGKFDQSWTPDICQLSL